MVRRIPAAALLLAACHGSVIIGERSGALSYAQYASLEKGMRAKTVLAAFGRPDKTVESDGRVVELTYRCEDASGKVVDLGLGFDADGVLTTWSLGDPGGKKPS